MDGIAGEIRDLKVSGLVAALLHDTQGATSSSSATIRSATPIPSIDELCDLAATRLTDS